MAVVGRVSPRRLGTYASATIRRPSAAWLHYLPSDLLLAAAMGAWLIAIRSANVGAVNDYGLLPALPPVFYGSLLIIVVSFVWTLSPSRPSQPRLWLHLMALVLVIHGTPALLFPEPWYAWVYKHVGVVAYISAHGAVNGNIDIYQNWPGFFALVAWVDRIAGVSTPLSYAAWAPVYFEVLTLLALLFAIRPLTPSIRVRWITLFLFEAANWVGSDTDYFSPQGLAFVLALVAMGMIMSWFRNPAPPAWAIGLKSRLRRRMRSGGALAPGWDAAAPGWPRRRRYSFLALVVVFAATVISHQLTPYMVLFGAAALTVGGLVRPRWLVLVLAAVTFGFLATRLNTVEQHYSLIGSLNPFDNTHYEAVGAEQGTAGRLFAAHTSRILSEGMWIGGCLGLVRLLRSRSSVVVLSLAEKVVPALVAIVLMLAPALVFFGQDYGGEAVFRAFLFSLPWASYLVACLLTPLRAWSRTNAAMVCATLVATLALLLPAYYGMAAVDVIRPDEVTASQYFAHHAPKDSLLMLVAPNFPVRLTSNYDDFNKDYADADAPSLVKDRRFQGQVFTSADASTVAGYVGTYADGGRKHAFLVLSTSQDEYLRAYSIAPSQAMASLDAALASSSSWSLFYRNRDVVIYELRSPEVDGP